MSIFDTFNLPTVADFSTASISQKTAEMSSRLLGSGQLAGFSSQVVNPQTLSMETQIAILESQAQASQEPPQFFPPSAFGPVVSNTNELKVKISQEPAVGDLNSVTFTVMPKIDESRSVEYEAVTPVHHPGSIMKYKSTGVRSWTVSARLMSRTSEEASQNLAIINMIRSWAMPFHGEGTAVWAAEKLGSPPPILTLSAYGPQVIGPVKCVLKSHNWNWDNQVDWIPTLTGQPWPVLMDISLQMDESWSPAEYSGFDLLAYKQGNLSADTGAFKKVSYTPAPNQAASTVAAVPVATSFGAGAGRGRQGGPTAEELNVTNITQTTGPNIVEVNGQAINFNF